MKKYFFFALFSAFLFSCGNNGNKTGTDSAKKDSAKRAGQTESATPSTPDNQSAVVHYQCPMKCEGDKVYDKPGNCPQCGMAMKEVK